MMKKIFFILSIFIAAVACKAQLPTVVEVGQDSFRIKRGEFVLRNETKNVKGFLYNTGFGVTKFIRFEKLSDTSFIWDTDTMYASNASVAGAITASRGLHVYNNDIRWGITPLDSAVTIDQVGNGITFHDGLFRHGTGDYTNFVSAYSLLEDGDAFFAALRSDGAGTDVNILSTLSSGGQASLQAFSPTGTAILNVSGPDGITLNHSTGNVYALNLRDSAQANSIYYDPATGLFTYGAASGGAGSITADRGLHVAGSTVRWGNTALDSAVDIPQAGNGITFHDGIFQHANGDYTGFASPWGLLQSTTNVFHYEAGTDATHFVGFTVDGGGNQISMQSEHPDGDDWFQVGPNLITMYNVNGNFQVPFLRDSAQDNQVYYDPATGLFTYGASAGGPSGTDSVYTANSGLSASTPTNFQLGSVNNTAFPLLHNTWINTDAYTLHIQGANPNWPLEVENTSTGYAGRFYALSKPAIQAAISPASTNTIAPAIDLLRSTTGTVGNGIGVGIDYYAQTTAGGNTYMGTAGMAWSDVNSPTRTSRYDISTTNSTITSRKLSIAGTGRLTLDKYGVGNFPGTPVFSLGVDNVGNVVEYTPSTGSGGGIAAVTGSNGLIATTSSNVELGTNPLLHNTTIPTGAFSLSLSGAFSGNLFNVTNTNTTGAAINAVGGTSAAGVQASGGLYGVFGQTTGGTAIRGISTSGLAGDFNGSALAVRATSNPTSTNTVQDVMQLIRTSTGTAANGIGGAMTFLVKDAGGLFQTSHQLISKWTDVTNLTRKSQFEIYNVNNAVFARALAITAPGQMIFDKYGAGTFENTPAYLAGWDASGNMVEIDPGSFGVAGTGASLAQVDSAVQGNTQFDPAQFNDADDGSTPITLNTSYVALQTDVTDLNARIDSLLNDFPVTGSKTFLNIGGAHEVAVIGVDSIRFKTLIQGGGVTITETDSTITVAASGAGSETNTLAFTLTTTGNRTITADNIVQYVLVKPASTLAGFKIGTVSQDDFYLTATAVTGGAWATFNLGEYLATGTTFYFSGITSSTDIKIVYKPLHE